MEWTLGEFYILSYAEPQEHHLAFTKNSNAAGTYNVLDFGTLEGTILGNFLLLSQGGSP